MIIAESIELENVSLIDMKNLGIAELPTKMLPIKSILFLIQTS